MNTNETKAVAMTPGPWVAARHTGKPDKRLGLGWCVNGPDKQGNALPDRVCDCYGYGQDEANARAIAALPELVEALRHALEDLQQLNVGHANIEDVCGIVPEIRAALQKAGCL